MRFTTKRTLWTHWSRDLDIVWRWARGQGVENSRSSSPKLMKWPPRMSG